MMSRMTRSPAVALAIALVAGIGCSRSTAPKARLVGEVASLGGVAGIVASTLLTATWSHAKQSIGVFAGVTTLGLVTYSIGELTDPARDDPEPAEAAAETLPQRNHRWAKILTERAQGAAREGRCPRVRRLEPRIRDYDAEIHDFVFMRDPAIQRCLATPDPAPANPSDEAPKLPRAVMSDPERH